MKGKYYISPFLKQLLVKVWQLARDWWRHTRQRSKSKWDCFVGS